VVSAKVMNMHEARMGKMGDVIGEGNVLVKNYTSGCEQRFAVNVWVNFREIPY